MVSKSHIRKSNSETLRAAFVSPRNCRFLALPLALLLQISPLAHAQILLHNADPLATVNLLPGDQAVLEMEEVKKDLPCTVTPIKPIMGFDLRFHAGYDISIPLKELASNGQTLTVVFSVTPASAKDNPRYFSQRFNVPELPDDAGGKSLLEGGFDVGEGTYHVRWLMRDHQERVCSSNWDITATRAGRDQDIKMNIVQNDVQASESEFFKPEPPVDRKPQGDPIKVKLLINYAPQEMCMRSDTHRDCTAAAAMEPIDSSALTSILRTIAREPRIVKFSIVAFNLIDERVVYQADDLDEINFPDLGKHLRSVKLGMVDYKNLADPHSPTDFLTHLVQKQLAGNPADAVIFAGPKAFLDQPVTQDSIRDLMSSVNYPVFYMNYMLIPPGGTYDDTTPWRDAIGSVVKHLHGIEYTITRPRDLWTSWEDIMSHLSTIHPSNSLKMKLASAVAASSH